MRLVRSGFLVATTGLSLVAATLGGATAAQAATPCSVTATSGATFYGCWGDSNPDLVITMGANLTLSSRVLSSGAKRTIDLAGFNVTFSGGIQVSATDTLVIEDSAGTGTLTAGPSNDGAGIGGNADPTLGETAGTIIVNSGNVVARGIDSPGLGGGASAGQGGLGGTVTITGGSVDASATGATGIGGGTGTTGSAPGGAGGNVTITGGSVIATAGTVGAGIGGGYGFNGGSGGTVTIAAGSVAAVGGNGGAGIGGGDGNSAGTGGAGGTVTITGGTVNAHTPGAGAGIGGGFGGGGGAGGTVAIEAGSVTAVGGNGSAGIGGASAGSGSGAGGAGGSVTITDGTVDATGGSLAPGIGGGASQTSAAGGAGATLAIHGGSVTAAGGDFAPGIGGAFGGDAGDGGVVTVTNGTVEATGGGGGAGIGGAVGIATSGDGADVTIAGGEVKAVGGAYSSDPEAGNGAGIGSGMAVGAPGQAGSLVAGGIKGSGTTQTTGGAGGSATRVPDIAFATTGSSIAVVTPVDGTPAGVGSADIRIISPPAAPTITSVTPGRNELAVYFTAPAVDGGAAVDNYDYSIDGGHTWITRTPNSTVSPLIISGLAAGHTYQVQLRARSALGAGVASNAVTVATSGKRKQQLRVGAVPKRIKNPGVTVVNKRNARTKQGLPVRAEVRVQTTRGDLRCLQVINGLKRQVKIRTYGGCTARVHVTYRARANADYFALKVIKTYRI